MAQDWIVDVLADLRNFAIQNGLTNLAEQLDDTILVAATELAQADDAAPNVVETNASRIGIVPGGLAGSKIAG